MPKTTDITSINQKTYFSFLERVNIGEIPRVSDLKDFEKIIAEGLIHSGLISDSKVRQNTDSETNKCFITPEGAITLANWRRDRTVNSIPYKIGSALVRFLWVFVGALSASLVEILK